MVADEKVISLIIKVDGETYRVVRTAGRRSSRMLKAAHFGRREYRKAGWPPRR
jgi:hypothetical protein